MADQDPPAYRNGDALADQDAGAYGGPAYRNAHALIHSHASNGHAHALSYTPAIPDSDSHTFSHRFALSDASAYLPADGYASPHRDHHTFSYGHSLSNASAYLPADGYAFVGSFSHKNPLATSHDSLPLPIALGYRYHCANCFTLADPYIISRANEGPSDGDRDGVSPTLSDLISDGDGKAGLAYRHSIAWRIGPIGRSVSRRGRRLGKNDATFDPGPRRLSSPGPEPCLPPEAAERAGRSNPTRGRIPGRGCFYPEGEFGRRCGKGPPFCPVATVCPKTPMMPIAFSQV